MRRKHLIATLSIVVAAILAVSIVAYIFLNTNFGGSNGGLQVEWQQFLPGYSGNQIVQAPGGGYLAVGSNASTNLITGNPDYFTTVIHKLDSSGNVEWTKIISLGSGSNTQLTHAIKTDDGYLLAGWVDSYANIIKIDTQGNILWQKTYDFAEAVSAITQASDGGYAAAVMLPTVRPPSFGILKIDSSGNEQWHKGNTENPNPLNISNGFFGAPQDIFQTNDSGYLITSTEGHYGPGGVPIQIFRIDSTGNQLWNQTYFGDGEYYATYVSDSLALSDGYLLVGRASTQDGQWRGFILRTDLQGNALWNSTYTYSSETSSISTISAANGKFMFVGYAQPNPESPVSYTWVGKIDSTGKILDQITIPMGHHRSAPASLIQSSDGGHVFVGIWNQTDGLDQKVWVVKINS